MELKYVIAGAGATGGSIGAFLAADGRNVTFLARGAQLEAFLENGISVKHSAKGDFTVRPLKAMTMEAYREQPDVIFERCYRTYKADRGTGDGRNSHSEYLRHRGTDAERTS